MKIVVGVDGSPGSDTALRWAAEEARLRGARLEVLHVFAFPMIGELPFPSELDSEIASEAQSLLDDAVARAELADVDVDARVARGSAGALLVEAARDADLLVVGSRGRGGFKGLLLGSVSQQCAHHTPCPLVIVPSEV